jgi:hypothetical protein
MLRSRSYLIEVERFVSAGKKGRYDPLGIVLTAFYKAIPEFERSRAGSPVKRKNGFTVQGSWPSSGRQVFDWEMEAWGERGGEVIVKINLWSAKGRNEGITYRTVVPRANAVAKKFRKWFLMHKETMKKEAAQ